MGFDTDEETNYWSLSENAELLETIADQVQGAILDIKESPGYIQVELKFGRLIGKDKHTRIRLAGDQSRVVSSSQIDYFDSNVGLLRHWRKINDYVVNDFSDDYEWTAENTDDSIYDTRNGRGVVTWNYDYPGESYHTKKRIDNIFVYNPYGEFDFRIVVSEKCYRGKTAKRTAKRKGKLVLTRDKERRIWYDENNGTEFKSSTVTETPAVSSERHEFEIELDIESVIGDLGDRDDTLCEDIEGYINNLIQEADAVNEGVS